MRFTAYAGCVGTRNAADRSLFAFQESDCVRYVSGTNLNNPDTRASQIRGGELSLEPGGREVWTS